MAAKSAYQSFQTSWQKTVNWAKAQGIGASSYYPIYQMDSKRLLSGSYPMSEAERTRAILASFNPNDVTPLPTDTQSPGALGVGNFFSNVAHDASNIFTGLIPTHLVSNVWDSLKNTAEHPQWLLNPEKNTLAQFVPGVALLGEYEKGGLNEIASHPLVSFLNALPLADAGLGVVGHTALGDTLASKAGIAGGGAALGIKGDQIGAIGLGRRLVGNISTKEQGITKDATGAAQLGNLTLHQKLKNWANTKGIGDDLGHIGQIVHSVTQKASAHSVDLLGDFTKANSKLTPDESRLAFDLVTKSGKTYQELRLDPAVPVNIKEMLTQYEKVEHYAEEVELAADGVAKVRLPDGTTAIYSQQDKGGVIRARDALDAQIEKVDQLSKEADRMADNIQANDKVAGPAFAKLSQVTSQIQQAIKVTLSQDRQPELADRLRPVLRDSKSVDLNTDNVAKLLGVPKVNLTQARLVNEVFGQGGLIDQMQSAYDKGDFIALRNTARTLVKRFKNKSLSPDRSIPDPLNTGLTATAKITVSPALATARMLAENLYKYAMGRQREEVALSKAIGGKYASSKARSLKFAIDKQAGLTAKFERAVRDNPGAVWQPLKVRMMNEAIAKKEEGQIAVHEALAKYEEDPKTTEEELTRLREDPAMVIGIMRTFIRASSESPFAGMLSEATIREAEAEVNEAIVSLRAKGFVPHYVPNFSSRDDLGGYEPGVGTFNITIRPTKYASVDAAKDRMLDMSNSIYDLHAGMSKLIKQQITRDATADVIDNHIIPQFGYKQSELMAMIQREHPTLGSTADIASPEAHLAQILEHTYGMGRFDPASLFGVASKLISNDDAIWMSQDIIDGLTDVVNRSQFDPSGTIAKGTKLFRNAILGYSPRFVAHILFGGSFLVALRAPGAVMHMAEALRMLKDPEFASEIHATSTQRGYEDPVSMGVMEFHRAGGKKLANLWMQEKMEKLGLDSSKMSSYLQVIPQLTFTLTNVITDMQRAAVYLDGAAKAAKKTDYLDPATGERVAMTPERAHEMGMRATNKVMGDLSHMSPLERNTITTLIPFYGWTKHILQYVGTYPVDHPYRAMFLSNIANMNSDEVSKGLYTRIQNLFFLGQPDAQGNVSALDVRALNPLRDVANYATIGGLLSSLNPALTMLPATVDPQIVFGSNVLYPTLTYNDLYGTKTAAPAGNALTAAEQFVPELTTLDAALGLSSQYRTLRRDSPSSFAKVIFESLNIPFAQVEHLNLKQIAATQELDRFQAAKAAAQNAFETGDFGSLGNVASVPDPLQADYSISPASLEQLYNTTLRRTGLPPSEVLPDLPAPTNL